MEENNDIDLNALDARDTVSRQTNAESAEVCNRCCFPIETGFVKQVWDKVHRVRARPGIANALTAAIVNAMFAKSAPPQNNARTIGFVTDAENSIGALEIAT